MNYRTKKVKTEKNLKMVNPNTDSNLLQESQGGFTTFQSGYQGHGEDELTNFLIDLADELDEEGKTSEANFIDFLIKKNATTETKFSSDPFDKFMDKVYSHSEDESFDTTIYLKEVLYNYKENLKKYNHVFKSNNSSIEDLEKIPAYKRMGIEINNSKSEGDEIFSKTILNEENKLEFPDVNTYLHDNVD